MIKKPKLYYIEWCDACSMLGWYTTEAAIDWADNDHWIVAEVGWIIEETKEYILMASRRIVPDRSSRHDWGLLQKIPKTWIKKRKVIKL